MRRSYGSQGLDRERFRLQVGDEISGIQASHRMANEVDFSTGKSLYNLFAYSFRACFYVCGQGIQLALYVMIACGVTLLPDAGDAVINTSTPSSSNASLTPRQYCIWKAGRFDGPRTLKPNSPCRNTMGSFGVS
jgi:hypothetical protein